VSNIVKWCPVMAGSIFSCSMPSSFLMGPNLGLEILAIHPKPEET
jgi:hypothetical protein